MHNLNNISHADDNVSMADTERKRQEPRDKTITESEKKGLILNYNLGRVLSEDRKYGT